jgi:hypothetical protein
MEYMRRRFSPAFVLAIIALIIAVAGSSVAVSSAKKKKKPVHVASITAVTQAVTLPPQTTNAGVGEFQIDCPAGTQVSGGGLTINQTELLDPVLSESGPQGNGWHVATDLDINTAQPATLTALCFRP